MGSARILTSGSGPTGSASALSYSFVVAPERHGKLRRFPAYFNRLRFNVWALPHEAKLTKYRTDTIGEQMSDWFRAYRDDCLASDTPVTRKAALSACEEYFGRSELGEKFDAVWKLLAPDEWKKGGRKPKNR